LHPLIHDLLARQLQTGGADVRGATATIRVPLREAILNEVLAGVVLPAYPSLRRLNVAVGMDNRVDVTAASSQFAFLPTITVRLEVDPEVRGAPMPIVRLRVRREGVSGLVAPILSLMAKRAPPGVRLDGGLIEIHLAELLRSTAAARYVRMLRSGRIETEPGVLWITGTFAID
jgi:hypothetical protein